MIKINLLPKSLSQKAAMRNTAILFGVVLLVLIGAGVGYGFKLQGDVQAAEERASAAEAQEQRVKGIQEQTSQLLASVQPVQAKLDFIRNVLKYNLEFPQLYERVARWTYDKAVVNSIQCDGATVTMRAQVRSLDDLGRYLLNIYGATDLFSEVQISQASGFADNGENGPGGPGPEPSDFGRQIGGSQASLAGIEAISGSVSRSPAEQQKWINFTVVCKLKTPIVAPQFAGGGGAPGGPGGPGGPPMTGGGGPPGSSSGPSPYPANTPDLEKQMGGVQ